MLQVASLGLWLALSASFAVSASIIGMPAGTIVLEIVRVTIWVLLAIGAVALVRALVREWSRGDTESSV